MQVMKNTRKERKTDGKRERERERGNIAQFSTIKVRKVGHLGSDRYALHQTLVKLEENVEVWAQQEVQAQPLRLHCRICPAVWRQKTWTLTAAQEEPLNRRDTRMLRP